MVDCSTDNFELNEIPPGYLTAPHAWSLLAALDQTLDGFALGTIILEAGEGPEQKGQLISSNISCNKQHGLLVVGGVVDSVGGILDLMRLKGN